MTSVIVTRCADSRHVRLGDGRHLADRLATDPDPDGVSRDGSHPSGDRDLRLDVRVVHGQPYAEDGSARRDAEDPAVPGQLAVWLAGRRTAIEEAPP